MVRIQCNQAQADKIMHECCVSSFVQEDEEDRVSCEADSFDVEDGEAGIKCQKCFEKHKHLVDFTITT